MAVPGLGCCAGFSLVVADMLLIAAAFLAVEHRRARGLSSCGSPALEHRLGSCSLPALERWLGSCGSLALEHWPSICGSPALEHRLSSCGWPTLGHMGSAVTARQL